MNRRFPQPLRLLLTQSLALALSSGAIFSAHAADKNHAPAPAATASQTASPTSLGVSSSVTESAAKSEKFWDAWYTVKVGGKIPYGYYHDRVEIKDGKIAFQNQYWKSEEGTVNEEQLVAFAQNDATLTPVLFQFKSFYRGSTVDLDGTVTNGILKVKVRKNSKEVPAIERSISKNAFFSSLFPVYLGKQLKDAKTNRKNNFLAILEDQLDRNYQPVSGHFTVKDADEKAKKTGTKKIEVSFNDQDGIWYVRDNGQTERIEIKGKVPGTEILVERAEEAVARRFLMMPVSR